ncbi:potassium channel family protein [Methanohalophilus mahii]|uniref:TrkA-N domain protein n=1 Tax=Methanohalophilus mahii (strain ATCC 35705 / DSM 5219 / SLP) TaxID=547558 RepID=D5E6N4_METMS|nr:potassium channel protein [Methanohalophilus mahii]ADE36822.1 TrkA-N domain protein [Methanohalophilus mahii DSM 5219]
MKLPAMWRRSLYHYMGISLGVVIIDTIVFLLLVNYEGQTQYYNPVDAIYWVISTATTVGYGDIVLTSPIGKIFAIFVQLSGVIMVFGILITFVITPWFERSLNMPLPAKAPESITSHIIICGYNKLMQTLIEELQEQNVSFVIIEEDEEVVRRLLDQNLSCIYGRATEDKTLENARIKNARFLIANRSDEENASIVLTASNLADTYIISVAEDSANIKYLKYAGAKRVVSPKLVLGRFLGKKGLDPYVRGLGGATAFLGDNNIVELPVYPASSLIGKSLKENDIHTKTGANIIGLR